MRRTRGCSSLIATGGLFVIAPIQPPLFEPGTEDLKNSRHGTLHLVLLDGSVKAIGRSVGEDVLSALSTASGGEVAAGALNP
jgi:hypothetical protein